MSKLIALSLIWGSLFVCPAQEISGSTALDTIYDQMAGAAHLSYDGSNLSVWGSIEHNDFHGSLTPSLKLAHLYRWVFTPETSTWLPPGLFTYPCTLAGTKSGHLLMKIGPMNFDIIPANAVVRQFFASHAGPPSSAVNLQVEVDPVEDAIVISIWQKAE
jgi:hypothetical protein